MGPVAVALIALLMLGYASVRSTVMQVAGMPSTGVATICGDPGMSMPGMDMGVVSVAAQHAGHLPADTTKHGAACPYCSAAANAAIMDAVAAPQMPSRIVFVAFHPVDSHGPRGPPATESRARGPPSSFTTA